MELILLHPPIINEIVVIIAGLKFDGIVVIVPGSSLGPWNDGFNT
jgi:hypothetical protein